MATVDLTVAADLSALRRQLAEIPGLTADAATKMSAELNKSIKSAEKASLVAAKASKAAAEGVKASASAASDASGKVGQSSAKLAGALSLISPAAGDASRNLADFADVGEVASEVGAALGLSTAALGVALLAVAEAAAIAYVAYRVYTEESDRAAQSAAWLAASEAALKPILDDTRDATIDLKVATGELTEEQGALERASIRAFAAYQEATGGTRKQLATLKGEQSGVFTQLVDLADSVIPAWTPYGVILDGLTTTSGEYQVQVDELQGSLDKAAKTTDANRVVHKKLIEVEKKGTASKGAIAKASDDEAKALAAVNNELERQAGLHKEQAAAYDGIISQLNAMEQADITATLSKAERVDADHEAALKQIEDLISVQNTAGMTTAARETLEQEAGAATVAETARYLAEVDGLERASADARIAEIDRIAAADAARKAATESATLDLLGATSEAFAMAAEEQSKTNKDAAMAMFVASKAAAVAQAVVNTALAISSANTLPPPANFIAMAAAGVSGAVSLAAIASSPPPSFNDTPGVQMMGQRGNVSLASGDYFAAARSPTELQRQVGATAGGGVSILQVRLGHKVLDQSVARTIQEGGRLSREISSRTKTGTTGHRSRA
jgi:hypothetical protein